MSSPAGQLPPVQIEGASEGMKALVRMFQALFFLLRILIICIFVFLLFSGVFYVRPQYEMMLFRFGRLQSKAVKDASGNSVQADVLRPGHWYWAWPYPIDRTKQIPAQMSVTVETDAAFLPKVNPNVTDAAQAPPAVALRPGEDGYVLTGDNNIVHMLWSLTYRVTDPKRYYLGFYDDTESTGDKELDGQSKQAVGEGGKALIRDLLTNAVITEAGSWNVMDVILKSRTVDGGSESLQDVVKGRVLELVDLLDLGITVQEVTLKAIFPPAATQDAFERVFEASNMGDTMIKEAEAYREQVIPQAKGDAFKILSDAKVYRKRVEASIVAQGEYYRNILTEYKKNPDAVLVALYTDTIRDVLAGVKTKYILPVSEDGNQEIRLLLGPEPARAKRSPESE